MAYARRKVQDRPRYWDARLPHPVPLRHGRTLATLSDASSYIDHAFPARHRSESVDSLADALLAAAGSGDKEDIEFAAMLLRMTLAGEQSARGGPDQRYERPFTGPKLRARG